MNKYIIASLSLLSAGAFMTGIHMQSKHIADLKQQIEYKDRAIRNFQRTVQHMGKYLSIEELIVVAGEQLDDLVFEDIVKDI